MSWLVLCCFILPVLSCPGCLGNYPITRQICSAAVNGIIGGTACLQLSRDRDATANQAFALIFSIKSNLNPNVSTSVIPVNFANTNVFTVFSALQARGTINTSTYTSLLVNPNFISNPSQPVFNTLIALRDAGILTDATLNSLLASFDICAFGATCTGSLWIRQTIPNPIGRHMGTPGLFEGKFPESTSVPNGLAVRTTYTTPNGVATTYTPLVFLFPDLSIYAVSDFAAGNFAPTYFSRFLPTGNKVLLNIFPRSYPRLTNTHRADWAVPQKVISLGKKVVSPDIKPGALVLSRLAACYSQLININPQTTLGDNFLTNAEYCWVQESDVVAIVDETTNGADRFTPGTSQIRQPWPATKIFRTDSYSSWN